MAIVCRPAGKASHLCATAFCRNPHAPNREVCHKCHTKWYRETHPINYTYHYLRVRARRRKILFNLTLSEFAKFCAETDYIARKGRFKDDLSIDRKREGEPYQYDNIQVLTVGENSAKRRAFEAVQRKINGHSPAPVTPLDTSKVARHVFSEPTPPDDPPW